MVIRILAIEAIERIRDGILMLEGMFRFVVVMVRMMMMMMK